MPLPPVTESRLTLELYRRHLTHVPFLARRAAVVCRSAPFADLESVLSWGSAALATTPRASIRRNLLVPCTVVVRASSKIHSKGVPKLCKAIKPVYVTLELRRRCMSAPLDVEEKTQPVVQAVPKRVPPLRCGDLHSWINVILERIGVG